MLRHYFRKRPLQFFIPTLSSPRLLSSSSSSPAPVLAQLLSEPVPTAHADAGEIGAKIRALNLTFTPESVNSLISDLRSTPDACYNFFTWVVEREEFKPDSRCYNSLLRVLGAHDDGGRVDRFWGVVGEMKRGRGYGIDKETFLQLSESFEERGLTEDLKSLKGVYENAVSRVCGVLRSGADEGDVFNKLDELCLDSVLSSDLIVSVLEKMEASPKRALFFFNWLEQRSPGSEIADRVYGTMITVLAKEGYAEEFSGMLKKAKNAGVKVETDTYVKLMRRLIGNRLITAAVDLFQFNPSDGDLLLLLKKVVSCKDFDVELVYKVVSSYLNDGNTIENPSIFGGILKSLVSVGRLGECDKVVMAMERGGFKPNGAVHTKVVLGLCDAGRLEEAVLYLARVAKSGCSLDTGFVLNEIVTGFCIRKQSPRAYKVLKEMAKNKVVKPRHDTYKYLIERLVHQRSLKDAFKVLPLMKNDGFPPFIDPLVEYIAKKGSVDDAVGLLNAMTEHDFPSRRVYLRLFEALFQKGRGNVAQDLLSRSPGGVRNNADVLDLFYAMNTEQAKPEAVSRS